MDNENTYEKIEDAFRIVFHNCINLAIKSSPPEIDKFGEEYCSRISRIMSRCRPHNLSLAGNPRFARWFFYSINDIIKECHPDKIIENSVTGRIKDISKGYIDNSNAWHKETSEIIMHAISISTMINYDFPPNVANNIRKLITQKWDWIFQTTNSTNKTNMEKWFLATPESIDWAINYLSRKDAKITIPLPNEIQSFTLKEKYLTIITLIDAYQSRYDPNILDLNKLLLSRMKKAYEKFFNIR